jgi:hypothetical protein
MLLLGRDRETPLPPGLTDADAGALFKEARLRQRRRWALRIVIGCAVLGGSVAIIVLAVSGDTPRGANAAGAAARVTLPTGPLATVRVAGPLAVGPTGALYVADVAAHRVLVRLPDGRFRVVAGTGTTGFSGDGGPAVHARLSKIVDLAFSPSGNLYVADGGRVRVIDRRGVIRTVAGDGQSMTKPVKSATPALSAALGSADAASGNPLSIAASPSGQLIIATGLSQHAPSQLLRLADDTLTGVRVVVASGMFKGSVVQEIGRVAVDAAGNIYTSGGYGGWVVWQITPHGAAYQVRGGSFAASQARRSGGDYSVLERSPSGGVYAEDGPGMRRIQGHRFAQTLPVTDPIRGETFWLTYFAFAPNGMIYADEIPGGGGFEAHQQLIAIAHDHPVLLWQERNKTPR